MVGLKGMKFGLKKYRQYALKHNFMNVNRSSAFPGGFQFPMTELEARYILGLDEKEKFTNEDVSKAFAKMITNNHPDIGHIKRRVIVPV